MAAGKNRPRIADELAVPDSVAQLTPTGTLVGLAPGVCRLPETLPAAQRRELRVRAVLATYGELLRDAKFVVLAGEPGPAGRPVPESSG